MGLLPQRLPPLEARPQQSRQSSSMPKHLALQWLAQHLQTRMLALAPARTKPTLSLTPSTMRCISRTSSLKWALNSPCPFVSPRSGREIREAKRRRPRAACVDGRARQGARERARAASCREVLVRAVAVVFAAATLSLSSPPWGVIINQRVDGGMKPASETDGPQIGPPSTQLALPLE